MIFFVNKIAAAITNIEIELILWRIRKYYNSDNEFKNDLIIYLFIVYANIIIFLYATLKKIIFFFWLKKKALHLINYAFGWFLCKIFDLFYLLYFGNELLKEIFSLKWVWVEQVLSLCSTCILFVHEARTRVHFHYPNTHDETEP